MQQFTDEFLDCPLISQQKTGCQSDVVHMLKPLSGVV